VPAPGAAGAFSVGVTVSTVAVSGTSTPAPVDFLNQSFMAEQDRLPAVKKTMPEKEWFDQRNVCIA
jgi:hypothetical protein